MIERYTLPEMGSIWSQDHKIQQWLAVEIAVCEAWARRGRIPADAMEAIRGASCSLERMLEIERETDHDVIAFLRATGESVGDSARFIHLGLTSSDVVDTGMAMQARDASDLLIEDIDHLIQVVGRRALEHKDTITIGRSHGMQAEPTTFGLKLAVWYDELRRQRERMVMAREQISVGQISGAVGTHAHVSLELENEVCHELGLGVELVSTQVIQRDRHAFFLSVLAGIASTLEKMTTEVRHLQRSEVAEAEESFGEGNQGSSAMPHKRNPHESERISGLSRIVRSYSIVGYENVSLWHERDISHSSAERVVFPDACIVLDFMLQETAEIIDGLVVYPQKMLANLNMSGGLIYSQRILLALVDGGMDRQDAYKLVQHHAHADNHLTFLQRIQSDPEVQSRIPEAEIVKAFDPWDQLHNVDATFARIGLVAE